MHDLPTALCALLSIPIVAMLAAAWVAGFVVGVGVFVALKGIGE